MDTDAEGWPDRKSVLDRCESVASSRPLPQHLLLQRLHIGEPQRDPHLLATRSVDPLPVPTEKKLDSPATNPNVPRKTVNRLTRFMYMNSII